MNDNTISRQVRRANERREAKAAKSTAKSITSLFKLNKGKPTLIYAGAFYKDDCPDTGFSIGSNFDEPSTMNAIMKYYEHAMDCYDKETAACAEGTHPDYVDVTMDRIVFESMHNMKNSIINWNNIIYGSSKRKMGHNTLDFSWSEVHSDLFMIILGIVYGERHGLIKSDNFNGMSFQHMH